MSTSTTVLAARTFHHGNLVAEAVFNSEFEVWSIVIRRLNTGEEFDLHGIFLTEESALGKLESLEL